MLRSGQTQLAAGLGHEQNVDTNGTWNTDGAMGNYILLVILVILLMRQFPLNPYLNSNLPDANIGPQMLCPPSPPLLARLLLTSW